MYFKVWLDPSGNIYIFGGFGRGSNSSGYLNDMWKFDPQSGAWTWVTGRNAVDVPPAYLLCNAIRFTLRKYGTLGSGTATTMPCSREGAVGWTTSTSFYLFGGVGYSSSTVGKVFIFKLLIRSYFCG